MTKRTPSSELAPGTRLRHRGGDVVVLERRKLASEHDDVWRLPFYPGWWLRDSAGGLADSAVDSEDSDWTILDAEEHFAVLRCACEWAPGDNLGDAEACCALLAHIEACRG